MSFKAQLPSYSASVRAHPDVFPRLSLSGRFARIERADPPSVDGWIRVWLRFDVQEMAIEYALSFGDKMEVLEPATLRQKVINTARSVIDFYGQKQAANSSG